MRRLISGALAIASLGCGAGWHQPLEPVVGTLSPRQQVQVWHTGKVEQLHGVVVAPDSVTGIPYFRPLTCDACRVAIPRAAVDSLRLGNPEAGFWKTFGLVVGIPVAAFAAMCLSGCFPGT
jgi:hypothetical protein